MPRLPLIWSLCAIWAVSPLATPLLAQEATQAPLSARVVGRQSGLLKIDLGAESGVVVGDRVVILRSVGTPVEAVVQQVEARHAMVQLLNAVLVENGARAEVYVTGEIPEAGERPPHPGWESPPEDWDSEMPLLASPWTSPTGEPTWWRGRIYFGLDIFEDKERDGRGASTWRSGFELDGGNILADDDLLEIDMEFRRREIERTDEASDVDERLRIDRFAYGREVTRDRPSSWRVGRFQQSVSEFGLVDGAELVHSPWSGVGYGMTVGYLPQLYGDFESFDDLQVSGHLRWQDQQGAAEAGVAMQKTWDAGAPDRDVLLLDAAYQPRTGFHAYGTAWLDWYDSDERLNEGAGTELTQAFLGAGWRNNAGVGALLSWSRVSFPLLTADLGYLPPITDPIALRNERLRFDAWMPFSTRLRSGISAWTWDDQEESGGGGEFRLDAFSLAGGPLSVGGAIHADAGRYSDIMGVRLHTRWSSDMGAWGLTWRGDDLQSALPGGGGSTDGFRQAVRASWDGSLGAGWSLSLWYQQDTGAEQDAAYAGFWLQWRS